MATINLGAIKFNWKGAYNNSTAYVVDDVVSSGGSSYVCILASTGNAVTNGTYWSVMAQAGIDGTNVATTLTTQGDILYRDGSGLARLGAGTSGQFLKTQGTGSNPVWADNSAVAGSKAFYSYFTSNFGVGASSNVEIVWSHETNDDDGVFNTSNGRYTPGVAGTYFVASGLTINDINGTGDDLYLKFFVNGNSSGHQSGNTRYSGSGAPFNDIYASAVIKLTSSTDYISAFVYQDGGSNRYAQADLSYFTGFRLA